VSTGLVKKIAKRCWCLFASTGAAGIKLSEEMYIGCLTEYLNACLMMQKGGCYIFLAMVVLQAGFERSQAM
jgi:hypothetical protein